MCNHKVLIIRDLFCFWVLLVWYKLSIQFFVMLKTWQFSQKKKNSKNYSNLHKEKKIPKGEKKKKKIPKIFPNLFVDKTTKLVVKKITC